MPFFSHYGTGQRVGFIIVCVGFAFCLIGSIAPYWITAKTSENALDVDLNVGIWYYCVDYSLEEKCFSLYNTDNSDGYDTDYDDDNDRFDWINVVRSLVFFNVLLSLISGLVACCRCACCSGGRTICHGILSFLAGVFGLIAFIVFHTHTKSLVDVQIAEIDYAWACGLYVVGSILLVIASFVLCCAQPREMGYGVVYAPAVPAAGININVANTNTNTNTNVNQYNAGGPIQSFEPLPNMPPQQPYYPQQPYPQQGAVQPTNYGPPAYDYNSAGALPSADHTYATK